MKKLLLGSAVLTALSLSIIAFQLSCSKTANAQTGGTSGLTQLNKIIYETTDSLSNLNSIWTADYNGNNKIKINISIPVGLELGAYPPKFSPDGQTIFLVLRSTSIAGIQAIYSCKVDGSNMTQIISKGTNTNLGGAY